MSQIVVVENQMMNNILISFIKTNITMSDAYKIGTPQCQKIILSQSYSHIINHETYTLKISVVESKLHGLEQSWSHLFGFAGVESELESFLDLVELELFFKCTRVRVKVITIFCNSDSTSG